MRRFSIRTLMAFVLVSAVGLAALRTAGDLSAGLLFLVALAAVGVAILGATFMRGAEQAWWIGFALFCGGYLTLACWQGSSAERSRHGSTRGGSAPTLTMDNDRSSTK
jgi:hypothetical protein